MGVSGDAAWSVAGQNAVAAPGQIAGLNPLARGRQTGKIPVKRRDHFLIRRDRAGRLGSRGRCGICRPNIGEI